MNPILAVISSLLLSAGIGYIDVVTGQEIVVSIFYLIPIAIGVWYVGSKYGYFTSFLCTCIWYYTESTAGREYSSKSILFWDALVLAGFLVVFAIMLYEIKKLLGKERMLSRTDYLTGLANRRHFFESVEAEISRTSRSDSWFSIAYIDADNFKWVNDNMGHHAGDRALILIASALKDHTRKMDITARIGGDEFAVLLPTAGEMDAENIIKKIQEAININMKKDGFPVTCSIGAVVFNKFPGSADNAMKLADSIMYDVKQNGKNALKFLVY